MMSVTVDGVEVIAERSSALNYTLNPGDQYIAFASFGRWLLLTCERHNVARRFVVPQETAYAYDAWECHRVIRVITR
jgi:hypothetical protein